MSAIPAIDHSVAIPILSPGLALPIPLAARVRLTSRWRVRVADATTLTGYFGMAVFMLVAAYGFYFCFERQTAWLRKQFGRMATDTRG